MLLSALVLRSSPSVMEDDTKSPSSSCREGCERVAWASVAAATLTSVGVVLVVAFISLSKSPAASLFEGTYIADSVITWFSWLEIGAYIGLVLMISLVVLLLSMGCMATGYQNASSWCSFNKAQTGRRQLTVFMIVTYIFNLGWYIIFIGSTLPTIFFFMVNRGVCSSTVFATSTCLDLRQFGLAPQCLPGCASSGINTTTHLICGTDLVALCDSDLLTNFFVTLIGCILVLLGMNHFLMSLSGNYNWLRIRKRRQKLQASKVVRRSGHYDIGVAEDNELFGGNNAVVGAERQLSADSGDTHLRRVNFQTGSTSNGIAGSSTTDSIPTIAAQVSTTPMSFSMPTTTASASSASARRPNKSPTSTNSSQRSTKIYNQTYGLQQDAIRHQLQQQKLQQQQQQSRSHTRVNFADTHANNTAATTWSFSNAPAKTRSTTNATSPRWSSPNDAAAATTRQTANDAAPTRSSNNAAPAPQVPSTAAVASRLTAPAAAAAANPKENNISTNAERDAGGGSSGRFDHFNPGYDNDYWDHPNTASHQQQPLQTSTNNHNDDFYSKGYKPKAQPTSSNKASSAGYYDDDDGGGNYNQGFYNYDYDVADGSAGGFEMKPTSTYGQGNSSKTNYGQTSSFKPDDTSLQRHRTPIGHNFYEYQL